MNSKSVNNKLNKDFGGEDQETSRDVENNFSYWIEWTIVDTEKFEKKKMNKTKIARHVACVAGFKRGKPKFPLPLPLLMPATQATRHTLGRSRFDNHGQVHRPAVRCKANDGLLGRKWRYFRFFRHTFLYHTTYRIVCCIANTLQQMNRDKKTCRFPDCDDYLATESRCMLPLVNELVY